MEQLDAAIAGIAPADPAPQVQPVPSHVVPPPQMMSSHSPDALDDVIADIPPVAEVDAQRAAAEQARKGELLRWSVRSETRAPEEQAEIMRLSIALNEHPEVVADDLPWARKEVEARKLDTAAVLRAHPALAEFLGNPETSALARGDTARLTKLSYLFGGQLDGHEVQGLLSRLLEGREKARGLLDMQSALMTGEAKGGPVVPGAPWEESSAQPAGPVGIPGVVPAGTRPMTEAEKEGLRGAIRKQEQELATLKASGDGIEELGIGVKQVAKTARLLVDMGPEMVKGAVATAAGTLAGPGGSLAAGTAFWASETQPSMYWQLSELKDAEGKPVLTDDEAKNWARIAAIPLGAAMSVSLESMGASATKWATSKPIVERALATLLPSAAKRLTTAPGLAATMGRIALNYGTHVAEGGLMMGVQSGIQRATLEAAKATHGGEADASAVGGAFVDGAIAGVEDFAILAAWGPARRMLAERGRISASVEGERVLRDIGNETRESKLAQRSPEKFEELTAKFGPERKVYLDRGALDRVAEANKTTGRELAAEIFGDKGEAYDTAAAGGHDLAIPLERWATKVAKPGLDAKLLPDARVNLTDLTPNQRVEEMKRQAAQLEERATLRGPAFEAEVAQLRKTLQAAARSSGHRGARADQWADDLSRYTATKSLEMDVPLRDAIVRVGLPQLRLEGRSVLGPAGEPGGVAGAPLKQKGVRAAIAHVMKALGVTREEAAATGMTEFLAQADIDADVMRKAAKTPEEKAAAERIIKAAFTDGLIPELGNQAAHESFMKSEQAKTGVHVITDMPGLKARNDSVSQMYGDQALKAYGSAFSAASRANRGKAHRMSTGDEFYAWFLTREQADSFKADLKARLAGPEGTLNPGDQLSTYMGVGTSKESAAGRLHEAKAAAKEKYGDSRDPNNPHPKKVGHGESFIFSDDLSTLAPARAPVEVPKGEVGVTTLDGAGQVTAKLKQGDRGVIRMRLDGKGRPVDFNIEALGGDKSTLAHETAHFLGWSLDRLAGEKDAPESIRRDYDTLLKFGGWESRDARAAENLERTGLEDKFRESGKLTDAEANRLKELTAKEEKVAHAWEQYLADGKAPTTELRPLFTRYRRWMSQTYQGLPGPAEQYRMQFGQELNISPEVRGVFDRMLAVDNEVERARAEDARVDVTKVLRLTPEEQAQVVALREAKYDALRETVDGAVAADGARASTGPLAAARDRIRADVHAEVSAELVFVAGDFLRTGELRDPETGHVFAASQLPEAFRSKDGPLRLSRAEAVSLVGEEKAKALEAQGLVQKKGATADEVGRLFGYDTGADFVRALLDAPDREKLVEQETQARFEDAFGPALAGNQAALEALGNDGLHNPHDITEAITIRNALAREVHGNPGALPRDVLKRNADRVVSGTRHAELSPKVHLDAERKGARKAFDLMAEAARARDGGKQEKADGLYREALHEWDGVLLSKALYRASKEALARVEKNEAKLEKAATTARSAQLGKADIVYSDANDSILASIGKKEAKSNPLLVDSALAALKRDGGPTAGVVEFKDEAGNVRLESAFWDSKLLRDLATDPVEWSKLTVDEGEHVVDAIEQMRKAASRENKLTLREGQMAREEVIAKTEESSRHLSTRGEPFSWKGLKPGEFVYHIARRAAHVFDSRLTETEAIVDRLTGNDRNHPLWDFIIGGKLRARDVEASLNEQFTKRITDLWKDMPPEQRARASKIAEGAIKELPLPADVAKLFDRAWSRLSYSDLWMIALNLGNAGNKQRLLDGFGWTEKQVHDVLAKHLTTADWKWVQGVWDSLGDLYPHLERVHVADTGLRPEKVTAEPFRILTADGVEVDVQGGYFPAKYDPRVPSKRSIGEKQLVETVEQLMGPTYRPARTVTSHAKSRAEKNEDLLNLDFNLVPAHVATVVHDISHRLYVKELAGLVLNTDFQNLVKERMGQEYDKVFRFWARDVAGVSSVAQALEPVNKWMSFAKSRVQLTAVGFNIAVPMADFTNPLLPVTEGQLGVKSLADVTRRLATDWSSNRAFALESSGELRARHHHGNTLGIDTEGFTLFSGKLGAWDLNVQKAAYAMMEGTDAMTSTAVWLAKYGELTEGPTKSTHADAVRDADALVRKYFPSHDPAFRAAWLRDRGPMGYITFLYGFGNKVYQMNRRTVTRLADAWAPEASRGDKAVAIGAAMATFVSQVMLVGMAGEFLSGRGPDDKHDHDVAGVAGWAGKAALNYATYQLPAYNAIFGGSRGALPISGLVSKIGTHLPGHQGQPNGPAESLAFWGSLLAAGGSGLNSFSRAGEYADKGLLRDLRGGRYANATSNLMYGDRGAMTPVNILPTGKR
jgi:hypothetical protein